MAAVAAIDDRAVDLFRQQLHGARVRVTYHQHVRVHGVQRHRGVDQGLALLHRAGGDRHVDEVAAEALGGQLERRAGARRFLEEQVDDGAAVKDAGSLVGAAVLLDVAFGTVQ